MRLTSECSVLSAYSEWGEKPSASQTHISSVIFIYIARRLASSWATQPNTNNTVTVSRGRHYKTHRPPAYLKGAQNLTQNTETRGASYTVFVQSYTSTTYTEETEIDFVDHFISKEIHNSLFKHSEIHYKQVFSGILFTIITKHNKKLNMITTVLILM